MKIFGTKQPQPSDEDRVAAARLSAVAARFKGESSSDFTEVSPDPLGEPKASEEPEASEDAKEVDDEG